MAKKFTVLFGAGASMDAGLPSTYKLTKQVYDRLTDAGSGDAVLFAVVVAKLIARNAKNGRSPFDEVNIEDVYDGLKRLLHRESDLLSEFVSGWDPISTKSQKPFDAQRFAENLATIYQLDYSRRFDGGATLNVNQGKIAAVIAELQRAIEGDLYRYRGASLEPFLVTLSEILRVDHVPTDYMEQFVREHALRAQCIATLNYDRLVEASAAKQGFKMDLGLSQWNDKRVVKFHGQSPKLLKLHGSVDWFIQNDDEILVSEENASFYRQRAMIFGGQSEKLVPYGPFLHLRHEFQRFLRECSYLLVVGYSFRDLHLNAVIRSWIATRNNGKMILVDPGPFEGDKNVFRYSRRWQSDGRAEKARIQITEIKKSFASAMDEIKRELESEPDLSLRSIR